MPRKIVNFADVITIDDPKKFIRRILGGRPSYICSNPRPGSTMPNKCMLCNKTKMQEQFYCEKHYKKTIKKIYKEIQNNADIYLDKKESNTAINDKIKRIKSTALSLEQYIVK